MQQTITGKPSIDRPWMQYYPAGVEQITIPDATVTEYLRTHCPGLDKPALQYYGSTMTWSALFAQADQIARSLRVVGFGENDQIPVFLQSVPQFLSLLLAAEQIGASLLCRDNSLEENVSAVANAGAKAIFAHDYLSQEERIAYLQGAPLQHIVLISPVDGIDPSAIPTHVSRNLHSLYTAHPSQGPEVLSWTEFLALGDGYTGPVAAPRDIHRPLLRAYTSGSTGPSKQVVHSANSMLGIIHQMNFYAPSDDFFPTWLHTCLPPALVAVVVVMLLLPMASHKLLVLDPFCAPEDVDLALMQYRPNFWTLIPMFVEVILHSKRIPADYDMSHMLSVGAGCEAFNNSQLRRAQQFLIDHNCKARFTLGYGSSEAGSTMSLPLSPHPIENGNIGIPLPLTALSVFQFGTTKELGYNQIGEICKYGPGNMLGYDGPDATTSALVTHPDGKVWLHSGDIGYINEDGVVYVLSRGYTERFGGGLLALLTMENLVADARIDGLDDHFFVLLPDHDHPGYFVPYLYVVLQDGWQLSDIQSQIFDSLEPHMYPQEIIQLDARPFSHFKTNRLALSAALEAAR